MPPLAGFSLVGSHWVEPTELILVAAGASLEGWPAVLRWQRLLATSSLPYAVGLVGVQAELGDAVPRSLWDCFWLWDSYSLLWPKEVGLDRTVFQVRESGIAKLTVIGPPTEDTWEQILAYGSAT